MTKPDEILKNAVEHVLANDGFKILTPSSRSAVEDARKLLQWFSLPNSKEVFYEFAEKLVSDVDRCFDPPKKSETEDHESDNWIKLVDRGGLNHVSNAMYMAIVSMELEVQKQLQQDSTLTSKFKTKLTKCLLDSEDVMFFWSIVAAPWESGDEMEMKLLGMVLDMWLTIRGFSYTSDWMEKLKVQEKKTKQKSKGIRKTLYKD
ncbi:hypothetical protein EMCRGX_G017995 [Ephydatia muelleri]